MDDFLRVFLMEVQEVKYAGGFVIPEEAWSEFIRIVEEMNSGALWRRMHGFGF